MQTKTEKRKKALASLETELARGTNYQGMKLTQNEIIRIQSTIANLKRKLTFGAPIQQ